MLRQRPPPVNINIELTINLCNKCFNPILTNSDGQLYCPCPSGICKW